jgi:hypothetical protein
MCDEDGDTESELEFAASKAISTSLSSGVKNVKATTRSTRSASVVVLQ